MVCISHSLHKNEDCQLSQFWWDTLGPLPRGLWRSLQCRGRAMSLTRPPAGPLVPGQREGICLHCSNSSAPSKMPRAPLHCPLLLDRLLHTHPKTSFCLSSSHTCNLDLTTVANSSAPLHTQLAPGRERIYSAQTWEFSPDPCFAAGNHYFYIALLVPVKHQING